MALTHLYIHNDGLILKNSSNVDDKPVILTLQTQETDITVGEEIGILNFKAPHESGTDAILVCAGIEAVSEGTFAADNNATKLSFKVSTNAF